MGILSYNGKPTGVIFGFLRRILTYAEKFKTNDIILCWDSGNSIRSRIYPEYKEKRNIRRSQASQSEKLERKEMLKQVHKLRDKIIPELGFKNSFMQKGFEADDLLAYWTNKLSDRNIILITSDNDLYQCLSDSCKIYSPATKKIVTYKKFIDKFGVTAKQWAEAKAIGGCDGDNVKGIKGAADPKNNPNSLALKYIRNEINSGVVFERIKKNKKIIKRNRLLVYLPCPIKDLKRMLKRRNKYDRRAFIKIFDEYRFISMLENKTFKRWETTFGIRRKQ